MRWVGGDRDVVLEVVAQRVDLLQLAHPGRRERYAGVPERGLPDLRDRLLGHPDEVDQRELERRI